MREILLGSVPYFGAVLAASRAPEAPTPTRFSLRRVRRSSCSRCGCGRPFAPRRDYFFSCSFNFSS